MKCEQVINRLDSYLGCELSEIETFNIKKHLSYCVRCRREYDEMQEVFIALANHDMDMVPIDFTDNVLGQINIYEKDKNIKEVLLFKGTASIVAAVMITGLLNFIEYRPINLFSQIYRGSEKINRIVVDPVDRLSREIREIADSF